MPFPLYPGQFWNPSNPVPNETSQATSISQIFNQFSRLVSPFEVPANVHHQSQGYQQPQDYPQSQVRQQPQGFQQSEGHQQPQATFVERPQQTMPSTALVSSQKLVIRGAPGLPGEIKTEAGYSVNTNSGNANLVTESQDLVVSQQHAQNGTVARVDGALPLGTRLINHVPLGPEDKPGSHGSGQRRKFRNLINWVNELGRLYPDLQVAQENGWHQHITKLNRHIGSLESQLEARLKKEAHCPVFEALMPTYPQLWKYLDSKTRKRLKAAAPIATEPIPISRRLEAPMPIIKSEPVADSKEAILQTFASMPRPTPAAIPAVARQRQDFNSVEQKSEHGIHTNTVKSKITRTITSVSTFERSGRNLPIKAEPQEDDDEDCFIVSERQVNDNARNNRPAPTTPQRSRGRPRGSRNIPKSEPVVASGSIPATRSLRNRDVPLTDSRPRSRSPGFSSQAYRERSPRRDAIVEELSDSERDGE